MPHDKIKAAARKRMAETGEPYTAARRAVATEGQDAGCALAMSGEVHDWLAELHDSDPAAALRVVQALVTLMDKGASLGGPLVAATADSWPWALMQALDRSYQECLDQLAAARRGQADAVTLINEIEEASEPAATRQQIAEARRLLPGLIEARARLDEATQRLQARVDAWRVRREVLKAGYVAASGGRRVREVMAAMGLADDDADDDGGRRDEDEFTAQMERALGQQGRPAGLMELRPGAPLRADIRVLFAIEPPGTALLIAVLHGLDVVEEQFPEAVMAAADMLRRIREGQAPEAAAHAYADTRSFLQEFYPAAAPP
jgi:hypothetical protein